MVETVLPISPSEVTKAVKAPETCINISCNVNYHNLVSLCYFFLSVTCQINDAYYLDIKMTLRVTLLILIS